MKIIFRLRFHTRVGQSLFLTGNHESLGDGHPEKAIPLHYLNHEFWQAEIQLPDDALPAELAGWEYILRDPDGGTQQDWGADRRIELTTHRNEEILVVDSWNYAGAVENVFYTKPFKSVLLRANYSGVTVPSPAKATHLFRIKAPWLAHGQTLCLLGSGPELGNWNTAVPLCLNRSADDDGLSLSVDLSGAEFPIEYKYGVYDTVHSKFVRFEEGPNRISYDSPASSCFTVFNDGFFHQPATPWRGAGVAIPVFSLRTENSFGVGEFTDLKPMVDWCQRTGLKLIQLLPVNDTTATHTWVDSYPYAAVSAFALHPLYLNVSQLLEPGKKLPVAKERQRKMLNDLPAVDYETVMSAKLKFVRSLFPKQREKTFASVEYREFFERNRSWLLPYAAFCSLRDKFGTADFGQWPAQRAYLAGEIEQLMALDTEVRDEIELNYFIQFHLHRQLKDAADYAHANGVVVKGDLAIGVYRHSADVWQQPELFNTQLQAGAPPDAFAAKGQNWGFPTYNWPRMREDGFAWWRRRFEHLSYYFDAFRIDHILGFFRIWSIPAHAVEGILGYFSPALPVQISEFNRRGIPFNRDRFIRPFITDDVLHQLFGSGANQVKKQFLHLDFRGHFSLLPEFATQRQVEAHFAGLPASEHNRTLRQGLFDLISNVILLEVEQPHGRELHFRFAIEDTQSFKHFDAHARAQLKELYIDYFFRRQENFWMQEGRQKLPALKRVTNLLICGEDLGLVPACVPELMKQIGLLSLEIQRMPKAMHLEFSRPALAPYLSVVTPSTHDMSTIRGWWEEDRNLIRKFFHLELGGAGEPPEQCTAHINQAIVEQHLASPAMWSIFQLQDLLGMSEHLRNADVASERINIPANPRHYWRYRMHLSLENLLCADDFNRQLHASLQRNQR